MLRVAAAVGNGAILNWLSADDVRKSVRVVREAATQAGRDPEAVEIAARLFVCVDPPTQEADPGARRDLNTHPNGPVHKALQEGLAGPPRPPPPGGARRGGGS